MISHPVVSINFSHFKRVLLALFLFSLLCVTSLWGATYTWTGTDATSPNDWNTAGNWSSSDGGTTYPGSGDDVVINSLSANSTVTIELQNNVEIKSLTTRITHQNSAITIKLNSKTLEITGAIAMSANGSTTKTVTFTSGNIICESLTATPDNTTVPYVDSKV